MLMIRLQRVGKRGQAYFRVVLVEHTKKPKGEYKELLGTYDPHLKKFSVKKERIELWISQGAQISPTVNNLMVNYKIWDKPKKQSWKPKRKEQVPVAAAAPASVPESAPEVSEPEAQPEVPVETIETPTETEKPTEETPAEPEIAVQAAA